MKKWIGFVFLAVVSVTAYTEEPTVVKFNNLLNLRTSFKYNFMLFETEQNDIVQTNRPGVLVWKRGLKIFTWVFRSVSRFPIIRIIKNHNYLILIYINIIIWIKVILTDT